MVFHWSTEPFIALYDAISKNDSQSKQTLTFELQSDLISLLTIPEKSDSSRKKLESGELNCSDGSIFKINESFIENSIILADSLNIDEMIAAEILYFASTNELNILGTSYLDSAIAAYYNRRDYILQIVSYYLCSGNNENNIINITKSYSFNVSSFDDRFLINEILKIKNYSTENILKSFKAIENELKLIKESIERSKLLQTYYENSLETKTLCFRREMLFKQYQLLGEILFGYTISSNGNFTFENFIDILNHISTFKPEDIFLLCYLPSLILFVSNLSKLQDNVVENLHKKIISYINDTEKLSDSPLIAFICLVFLTHFIEWCKKDPIRVSKYEFATCVEEPMQKCISVGALEQLLSITAETSLVTRSNIHNIKPFYDYRTLLQQHIPRFIPLRLFDDDDNATLKLKNSLQQQKLLGIDVTDAEFISINSMPYEIQLTDHFIYFLVPLLSNFIHSFISTAAFMMTKLRDQEEDLLLSSNDFDLELLTENADLERLYMSMYYLYSERIEYCSEFWIDPNSASYGFLQWASRCNSPLIMSTFAMVLAALASGDENSINVFTFLQLTNSNNSNLSTNPKVNSTLLTKYSSISWSTIYSTLSYYNNALSNTIDFSIQTISNNPILRENSDTITELGEDSIIYISSFFQVISQVALNNSKARAELRESDNYQLFTILTNLLNTNCSLNGPIMTLLSSLVGDDYNERCKFWQSLDDWIFKNDRSNYFMNFPLENFSWRLTNYQSISGFIDLIAKLLSPLDSAENIFQPLSLSFPMDLGILVRRPGIWCYLEFLLVKVLPNIDYSSIIEREKISLKISVLNVIELCLNQLDPDLILNTSACGIKNMDNITKSNNIISYLQSHPGSAVLCYLYNSKVHDSLFKISNLGIDTLNQIPESSQKVVLLEQSIRIIKMVLTRERFYSDELINILRLPDNKFADTTNIGMYGLKSFYESFLLNLPLIANLSLYVGSDKLEIANLSLFIIREISNSKLFIDINNGTQFNLMKKNRLLALYETIDESIRIRSSFIDQLESPIISAKCVEIKLSILQFINNSISIGNDSLTVGHFLLGFDTAKGNFGSANTDTTILSTRSLFKSIIKISKEIIATFPNSKDLDFSSVRMCSLCLEIILKLCKSETMGRKILQYLRTSGESVSSTNPDKNYILFLLKNTHTINKNILFSGSSFDGQFSTHNRFCLGKGISTLNSFVWYRCSLIQLVATELHISSIRGSLSLNSEYLNILTHSLSFTSGSSKLMDLLDILKFNVQNTMENRTELFTCFDYEYVLRKIRLSESSNVNLKNSHYLSVIDKMVSLYAKGSEKTLVNQKKINNHKIFENEKNKLKAILSCSLVYDNYKLFVLKYLKSWCLLVQVIVSKVDMKLSKRSNFILEVFQNIIPKIEDYMEIDPAFAVDMVSLSVHLLHTYDNDRKQLFTTAVEIQGKAALDFERLFPIFKISLHGICLPNSSPSLRSDLYILSNGYLKLTMLNSKVISKLIIFIKSLDVKVFDVICHDSLVGEDSNGITSLILLEGFVKTILQVETTQIRENIIFKTICKGNYITLLIQKLKLTDECFLRAIDTKSDRRTGITLNELLYELTKMKTTISLLTRIAQTRCGAQQLLRNDIFGIIKECKFLQLDADLGFELNLIESKNENIKSENKNNNNNKINQKNENIMNINVNMNNNNSDNNINHNSNNSINENNNININEDKNNDSNDKDNSNDNSDDNKKDDDSSNNDDNVDDNFNIGNNNKKKKKKKKKDDKSELITTVTISLDHPLGWNMKYNNFDENFSKDKISYYEIFIPVFQLITTIVISLGSQNNSCICQAISVQNHFNKLITAVLKRELLYQKYIQSQIEEDKISFNPEKGAFSKDNVQGLQELCKLFTLLDCLLVNE